MKYTNTYALTHTNDFGRFLRNHKSVKSFKYQSQWEVSWFDMDSFYSMYYYLFRLLFGLSVLRRWIKVNILMDMQQLYTYRNVRRISMASIWCRSQGPTISEEIENTRFLLGFVFYFYWIRSFWPICLSSKVE